MNPIQKIKLWWYKLRLKLEIVPIHSSEILNLLNKKFPNAKHIECEDLIYHTCSYEKLKKAVQLIPVRLLRKYRLDDSDCDDFSREFWYWFRLLFPKFPMGRCNVTTSTNRHSLNFAIYEYKGKPRFTFVEPQTGKVSYFNYKPYVMLV